MEEKILIIGGTGTMGKPLVTLLHDNGYTLDVICRRTINDNRKNIRYYYGDAKNKDFIEIVLKDRYKAIIDFTRYTSSEFKSRYKILLSATDQYVCLSSAAVYSDIKEPKTELSPLYIETDLPVRNTNKNEWYCYEKAEIEDCLKKSGSSNWTIVRPGSTLNYPHYFWGLWMGEEWDYRILHHKKVIIPVDILDYKVSLTYGGDVSLMFKSIIENKNSLGQVYNVTSDYFCTWGELLEIFKKIYKKYGYEIREKTINNGEPLIKIGLIDEYGYYRTRALDRVFDSSKIYRLMGDQRPKQFSNIEEKLEEWIVKCIKTSSPYIGKDKIITTALVDKLTNEFLPPKAFATLGEYSKYLIVRFIPNALNVYARLLCLFRKKE